MVSHSMYAAWFRARESRLRNSCAEHGVPTKMMNQILFAFEKGSLTSEQKRICEGEIPIRQLDNVVTDLERNELIYQINRMLDEEAYDSA
jgi:hypothetical protein